MDNIPVIVSVIFILTTLLTGYLFYIAANKSDVVLFIIISWLILQGATGYSGFYINTQSVPPRFLFLVLPPLLLIFILMGFRKGKNFIDSLDLKTLTLLQVVRIPVELVLFMLFTYGTIPELMTFEGRNFDILAGITAPVVYYYGFIKKRLSIRSILTWNVICLILLLNIIINAVLSAPFPFQKFAFDQPNIAVFYFPYVWLPGFIVSIVFISHIVSIRQLIKTKDKS
jgi:hypothetical protein